MVEQYGAEFQRLAPYTGYNQTYLCDAFRLGLQPWVQKLLIHHAKPETIEEYITKAVTIAALCRSLAPLAQDLHLESARELNKCNYVREIQRCSPARELNKRAK